MADSFSNFEKLLREDLASNVMDLQLPNDDVIWGILGTMKATSTAGRMTDAAGHQVADGATRSSIGQEAGAPGWEASWRIRVQRGARVTGNTFGGSELTLMGANSDRVMGQAVNQVYLDPAQTAKRTHIAVKMLLKRMTGQVVVNRDEVIADMITQPLEQVAFGHIEDAVFQLRRHVTAHAWGDGTASIAQVDGTSKTIFAAAGSVTEGNAFDVKVGTAFRFVEGQRYVIGTDADPRIQNGGVVRCVEVDVDNARPWFQVEPGGANISLNDGDHIMAEGNYDFSQANHVAASKAMNGVESLLRNSGNFPATLHDVQKEQKLKSFISGDEANKDHPTPERIAAPIDKMVRAGIDPPPILVAQQELWTLYSQLERSAGATYPVPQGAAFTASGGVDGPVFSHMGKTFARLSSAQCRTGAVHGLNPSTLKKFIPLGDRIIRWLMEQGGVGGIDGIFRLVTQGSRATENSAADFDSFFEMGCDNPRGNFRRIGFLTTLDN